MDWNQIKNKFYFEDGSLRDIYIENTTRDDWRLWAKYVNENYTIEFTDYETETPKSQIDFDAVLDFWDKRDDELEGYSVAIHLDSFILNCFFFDESEIENDILPDEFNKMESHNALLDYMQSVSKLLKRDVILTRENYGKSKDNVLLSIPFQSS